MNESWNRIFRDWISEFKAIKLLYANRILDDEDYTECNYRLLVNVIEIVKSEVEE